ncbi:imidazolonepropionase [Propionispora vibrioides]|uniref:Imidazolonepropionase n=1 Tax=Propionispora vibrioides TaxID=112903 RepID=A0A1H8XG59_9FIRM|nr:imidazolonepropionase [Propionispora vibrioides]SEP38707.1 imidazolonepropionase [Propionispora vibrioides]
MKGVVIQNAAEVVTPVGGQAKFGREMNDLSRIEHASVVIEDGMIQAVDQTAVIASRYDLRQYERIDAAGQSVIPGFVDSHTHFLFGGYRADEFMLRLTGSTYMELMAAGGGIGSTVRHTRQTGREELYRLGKDRLDAMLAFGITTVEGKSGYGLERETELKQLTVMQALAQDHPLELVSTFMGAHAVPPEYRGREESYIDFLLAEVLPVVKERGLAEFCDVFCEQGVFSLEQSRRLLLQARELGFGLKLHADEICSLGGAELAGELQAVSAEHLLHASKDGIQALARNRVIATLLPSTAFCLNEPFAAARSMIDSGCAVALASDFNPGSCFSYSVPLLLALACIKMKMTAEEALTALTLNGAAALNRAERLGSIEPGKQADLLILKYPSYKFLIYHTGINVVQKVIKKGCLLCTNR